MLFRTFIAEPPCVWMLVSHTPTSFSRIANWIKVTIYKSQLDLEVVPQENRRICLCTLLPWLAVLEAFHHLLLSHSRISMREILLFHSWNITLDWIYIRCLRIQRNWCLPMLLFQTFRVVFGSVDTRTLRTLLHHSVTWEKQKHRKMSFR